MNPLRTAGRGAVAALMLGVAGFFAWWAAIILGNIGDPAADNSDGTYLLIGIPLAAVAVMSVALAWTALRGNRGQFARRAAIAIGALALVAAAPYLVRLLT